MYAVNIVGILSKPTSTVCWTHTAQVAVSTPGVTHRNLRSFGDSQHAPAQNYPPGLLPTVHTTTVPATPRCFLLTLMLCTVPCGQARHKSLAQPREYGNLLSPNAHDTHKMHGFTVLVPWLPQRTCTPP